MSNEDDHMVDIRTPDQAKAAVGDLKEVGISAVRTVVPYVQAQLVTLGLDDTDANQAASILVALAIYVVVRLGETHLDSRLGWLLGYAKKPTY